MHQFYVHFGCSARLEFQTPGNVNIGKPSKLSIKRQTSTPKLHPFRRRAKLERISNKYVDVKLDAGKLRVAGAFRGECANMKFQLTPPNQIELHSRNASRRENWKFRWTICTAQF